MSSSMRQRRRRQVHSDEQNRSPSVEEVDTLTSPIVVEEVGHSGCIDLTSEDDCVICQHVVDLTNTSVNESPIVILGSSIGESPPRQRRRHARDNDQDVLSSDSEFDLLELPPFTVGGTKRVQEPGTSGDRNKDASPVVSPDRTITCPICLDTDKEIRKTNRCIFSTNCGHVFCNDCINDAIKLQKRCPSCRKRLTTKQIHPLYI